LREREGVPAHLEERAPDRLTEADDVDACRQRVRASWIEVEQVGERAPVAGRYMSAFETRYAVTDAATYAVPSLYSVGSAASLTT
jgi:hypothetical protein